jgi:hypothetical protein
VDNLFPNTGTYSALLDDRARENDFSYTSIILNINLANKTGITLDFWWKEFNDENHAADGVFISDDSGASWY